MNLFFQISFKKNTELDFKDNKTNKNFRLNEKIFWESEFFPKL